MDLENITTPVNVEALHKLLLESKYNPEETKFLVEGFSNGFDIGYRGPENIKQKSNNLKFSIGNKTELWNKVMKEVELKRYAGPFKDQYHLTTIYNHQLAWYQRMEERKQG